MGEDKAEREMSRGPAWGGSCMHTSLPLPHWLRYEL